MNASSWALRSAVELKTPRLQAPGEDREEQLDLVEPRRVGRGEMKAPARVRLEPGHDLGGLVHLEVVEDRVHTGEIKGQVYERHSRVEFLNFLTRLEAEIPQGKAVHAILDNLQVHKTPEVVTWLEAHPRWSFPVSYTHLTLPTTPYV